MSACSICNSPEVDSLESLGREASTSEISWREAAKRGGLAHHQSLKTHMEKHAPERAAHVADVGTADAIDELTVAMQGAPTELKPLYAVAIQNLRGLAETKPSQQHLISALKAIHEITGMKIEQRLLLDYAKAFPAPPTKPELTEDTTVIDVEVISDEEETVAAE